jgi:DNA-binding XRE family transcriptional regulator
MTASENRTPPDPRIAETLRRYRTRAGLSVYELARRSGMWTTTLYLIEGSTDPARGREEPRPPQRGIGLKAIRQLRPHLGDDFADEMLGILTDGGG